VVYLPQWLTAQFPLEVAVFGRPLRLFGLDVDSIATLFLAGGTASVLTGPAAGALSDRVGRKPLILASCAGFAVATAAFTYIATARGVVYLAYVLLLVLFSLRMAPLQAMLTALVPGRQRGSLLALTIAIGQVGTALGAALGGVLYAGPGYRVNTFASAGVALVMALFVWRALPEPKGVDRLEGSKV
jgi:MFS family permease